MHIFCLHCFIAGLAPSTCLCSPKVVSRVSSSPWTTKGETMSANNACAQFGITMEDLAAGNIPCQWRSCHGNSYAVVETAECERLAQRLQVQRKKEQEAELKAKLGEAGYAEKKQQDADAARTAADAASAARITAQIKAAAQRLLTIVGAYGAAALPRPAGRAQEPKATAKKLFKLTDKDLVGLETSTKAKATKARPQTQKMHLPT